ncbi:MAG: EF-P lysine aminoacylase EpmA [Desulfobulbaceae bacterium]|nr:EF-P lysine aminoacylase EpmA [Desulfobulbaceae bacterium]
MLSPGRLQQRSRLLQAVRSFFYARDYLEVDTPLRLPVFIPESHIIPFSSEGWFLQTSPEICMKRLLAAGSTALFQISHCFRKEESGRLHQSEFTLLEWYRSEWNYFELMDECEELIRYIAGAGLDFPGLAGLSLQREGREISLAPSWDRFTVDAVFRKYGGMPAREAVRAGTFDELLVTRVEPHLGWERPAFVYDYPVELGSLAREKDGNGTVAERFELYIAGIELVNGFSELVDPGEQRKRFAGEIAKIQGAGRNAAMPEKFLQDLGLMQDTAGAALGFDRLFMLLLGRENIAEAVCLSEKDL